jgi:hypothetical protein
MQLIDNHTQGKINEYKCETSHIFQLVKERGNYIY